jgi:hypothetical protein
VERTLLNDSCPSVKAPRVLLKWHVSTAPWQQRDGWDEEAIQGAFRNSLTETLKDEMVSREEPDDLDDLIYLAIRIDNRLRECRRERVVKVANSLTAASVPCYFPLTTPGMF